MTAVSFIIAIEQLDTFLGFKVDTPHGQFIYKVIAIAANLGKTASREGPHSSAAALHTGLLR